MQVASLQDTREYGAPGDMGVFQLPCSYLVFPFTFSGVTYYVALNGQTGIATVATDPTALMNLANGTSIYVKKATYTFVTQVTINTRHSQIYAEPGTVFAGAILPIFEIVGGAVDPVDPENALNDIQISNIKFYYTGAVGAGTFVYIHKIQSDHTYQGMVKIQNIVIVSNQIAAPTNENFKGITIEDCIGLRTEYLSIFRFGTCLYQNSTAWGQGSHNIFDEVMISECKRGVFYGTVNTTCEIWINPKIMFCTQYGFLSGADQLTMINPQFESLTTATTACMIYGSDFYIEGGLFSSTGAVSLYIYYGSTRQTATILNCQFTNTAIAVKTQRVTHMDSNYYKADVTTKLVLDGAYAKVDGNDEAINPPKHIELVPVNWIPVYNLSAGASWSPSWFGPYTGATAGSISRLWCLMYMLNAGTQQERSWDTSKRLEMNLILSRGGTSAAGHIAYIQLKSVNTEGELAAVGIGLTISNLTVSGTAYGAALGSTNIKTLTSRYPVSIKIILYPGTKVEYYVDNVLSGTLTGNVVPTGVVVNTYFVISANNVAEASDMSVDVCSLSVDSYPYP